MLQKKYNMSTNLSTNKKCASLKEKKDVESTDLHLPKSLFLSDLLSFSAKGLWGYLQSAYDSKSKDCTSFLKDLSYIGDEEYISALHELIYFGYLKISLEEADHE